MVRYNNYQYLVQKMLSATKIGTYTLDHNHSNEKLFKKNKFSPHILSPLDKYKSQLNTNANHLKSKFPNMELQYIKSLLEELENNIEMVTDVLEEEHRKQVKSLMEEERSEGEATLAQNKKEKLQQVKTEDVKVLQKSVAKLFRKFAQQKKEKQLLLKKLAILSKQNQTLKLMNQQLLREQMSEVNLMKNLDIC